jgi:hypothetical protein
MCVSPEGIKKLQLARQLMAASLNGAASGAQFVDLAACNAICANPGSTDDQLTDCIDDADDFNNAGDNITGFPPFDPPPSANSKPCKAAQNSDCTIANVGLCDQP